MTRSNRNKKTATSRAPPQSASTSSVIFSVADLISAPGAAPLQTFVDRASMMDEDDAAPWESERYSMEEDNADYVSPAAALPRAVNPKWYEPADKAMNKWMRLLRDIFLIQLLRRDDRGDADTEVCPGCANAENTPRYRCGECAGGQLCAGNAVWRSTQIILFMSSTNGQVLTSKGTLCRSSGCESSSGTPPASAAIGLWPLQRLRVVHENGIHNVNVDFCGCDSALRADHYIQLLRAGWYPATDDKPQTAATFGVLDRFHLHTLQAKTTAYDFYAVLEKLTDNTGVKPPNRYQIFLRMARQYRHLLMLKRAGRGHDPSGVLGTGAGELAIECPVCPNPKVNLPEGWENARQRANLFIEIKDPGLGTGWAYVLENAPYRHFLKTVTDQKEMSTCSGLAALDYANTKFSRGYSTTGVGMGVCARHEFVQANGVGDLQRGERFANMDYIFGSILLVEVPVGANEELLPLVRISIILALFRFVIPKMHIHSHTLDCQVKFSLNLVPGSGQTDSEGIERPWASIGAIATSTRVSGPGAHHDALDDHWNFWNWLKTIGLPAILRRRLDTARKEQASQREAFEVFSLQQVDRVPAWKEMVEEFEKDPEKKNPYEMKVRGLTEMEVRLQFATEEAEEAKKGVPALHEVTPSSFITAGLELEDEQRRVRVQAELKKAGTTAMQINMKTLWSKLNRGIDRFRKLQATYTPAAIQALAKRITPAEELAENVPLMPAEQEGPGCVLGLVDIEKALREAQCRMALQRLRNQLHIKSRFLLYKKHNSRHQGMNTRSRTIVARNESKIRLHSEKFQMAWRAQLRMVGGDKAKVGWPELKKEDICCMQDAEELSRNQEKRRKANERQMRREDELREDGLLPPLPEVEDDGDDEMVTRGGENLREISWIWTMAGTAGTDEEIQDALRIEWAKAWARSRRWTEEVRLLEEEWRRLPVTYAHRERQWVARASAVPVGSIPYAEAEGMGREDQNRAEAPTGEEADCLRGELGPDYAVDEGGEEAEPESDDEDDERGDIESDEELLMGGEVDED
ncbi:hypothetical protein B0H13DRAFT_2360051 [Mycena leptocephala]|nr:hypothetical protein B0H13DRAFT_2360051 [Mycena leptocephala]